MKEIANGILESRFNHKNPDGPARAKSEVRYHATKGTLCSTADAEAYLNERERQMSENKRQQKEKQINDYR